MPWSVRGLELEIADPEGVAVLEQLVSIGAATLTTVEPAILPVGVALVRDEDHRIDSLGQLSGAREEVGVNVRLGRCHDRQIVRFGNTDISVHISFRVKNNSFTRGLAANQIGRLSQ